MHRLMKTTALACTLLLTQPPASLADVPFPYRVVDGDTIANLKIPRTYYRLEGYDAPERWRPKCSAELIHAEKATKLLEALLQSPSVIWWNQFKTDIYGRQIVRVYVNGKPLSTWMIDSGYGVPYDGKKRTYNWCQALKASKR